MIKSSELRISILSVCILLKIEHPEIFKKALFLYRDYITIQKPDIVINVHYSNLSKTKLGEKLIYQTNEWVLTESNGHIFFSCYGKYPATAHLDPSLDEKPINFFSKDLEGHVLFFMFVFWVICGKLLKDGVGAIFHACGVKDRGKGFFFVGPSGAGKTTLCSLRDYRVLLADYNIFILRYKDYFKMFAPPWAKNKINLISKEGVIIDKIFFIEHAKGNFAIPINKISALRKLLKEALCYSFWDRRITEKNLMFCASLVEKVQCYRLGFVPDESVWEFLSNFF